MRHPFLRTLAGSAATPTDPNFENVTLLLHGDGTNGGQNNTFVDGSTNNFTITRNGNTTQGTFSPYGDNWSNYFDGTGDYLQVADNAALEVGSSDFTVECWAYLNALPASNGASVFAQKGGTSASNFEFNFRIFNNAGTIVLQLASSSDGVNVVNLNSSGVSIVAGTWYHFAVTKSGTDATLWIDGASAGTSSSIPSTIYSGAGAFYSGANNANANLLNGYISNLRLVKGTRVYTAAFTPPSAPLTAITNTSLLICQSNRFRDASTNNFTITRNGDVSVQRFSPFSPTAAYAAGTIGGSGYFDGTGDYLDRAVTSTTDGMYPQGTTWTLEAWVYPISTSGLIVVYSIAASNVAFFGNCWLGLDSGAARFDIRTATGSGTPNVSISGGTVVIRAWNHLAISVSSGSAKLWLNGSQVGSTTSINALTFTPVGAGVGRFGNGYTSGINDYSGYISDVRIIQSTAQYTAAFTPPTAPLTAITNTSLLLNFTNAAIVDNAMMAVPETVGNAQIDTTTKKYGTGSLEFDGTGDWLLIPDSIDQRLGTGNFTIECWLYLSATGTARGIVGKGTSTTGWLLSTDSSNKVVFTYGTSTITSTGTLSGSTWYHLAVVREGTGSNQTKIYIDGTNDGTGTVSTDFTQTNAGYVGANRTGGDPMNGFIDDLRVTKGVARYTANFTAPTAAFPDL